MTDTPARVTPIKEVAMANSPSPVPKKPLRRRSSIFNQSQEGLDPDLYGFFTVTQQADPVLFCQEMANEKDDSSLLGRIQPIRRKNSVTAFPREDSSICSSGPKSNGIPNSLPSRFGRRTSAWKDPSLQTMKPTSDIPKESLRRPSLDHSGLARKAPVVKATPSLADAQKDPEAPLEPKQRQSLPTSAGPRKMSSAQTLSSSQALRPISAPAPKAPVASSDQEPTRDATGAPDSPDQEQPFSSPVRRDRKKYVPTTYLQIPLRRSNPLMDSLLKATEKVSTKKKISASKHGKTSKSKSHKTLQIGRVLDRSVTLNVIENQEAQKPSVKTTTACTSNDSKLDGEIQASDPSDDKNGASEATRDVKSKVRFSEEVTTVPDPGDIDSPSLKDNAPSEEKHEDDGPKTWSDCQIPLSEDKEYDQLASFLNSHPPYFDRLKPLPKLSLRMRDCMSLADLMYYSRLQMQMKS